MTEPPRLARALLRVAELLTPATERLWVDAMRGDLDAAHAEGHALSWAFGCLIAAVHLRGAATFVLTPRRLRAMVLLLVMLLGTGAYAFIYHGTTGKWPFHSVLGLLVILVPMVAIGAVAVWRAEPIVVDDRWLRLSFLLFVVAFGSLCLSLIMTLAGGRFGTIFAAALSTAPLLLVASAAVGTLTTITAMILLCINFRSLPPRIPRVLPQERRFVIYLSRANREKILALTGAGAPETTLPRAWLIYSTLFPGFFLVEAGVNMLNASRVHGLPAGHERFLLLLFPLLAVLCFTNMMRVIAYLRFAHLAR